MAEARPAYEASTTDARAGSSSGAVDEWYIDDGQGFVKLEVAEQWLRSVDAAILSRAGDSGRECVFLQCFERLIVQKKNHREGCSIFFDTTLTHSKVCIKAQHGNSTHSRLIVRVAISKKVTSQKY